LTDEIQPTLGNKTIVDRENRQRQLPELQSEPRLLLLKKRKRKKNYESQRNRRVEPTGWVWTMCSRLDPMFHGTVPWLV
jgi:hypothetical protein